MPHAVVLTAPGLLRKRTYRRALPASWKEVPEARRLSLLQPLLQQPGLLGRVRALRLALELPDKIFNALSEDHLVDLLEHCEAWMTITPDPIPRIISFEHKGKIYHLPNANGVNLVALEYPLADEAFMRFVRTGELSDLLMLCGTLCREEEPDEAKVRTRGDKRVPLLSRPEAEARAKDLEGLSPDVAMAVMFYFAGIKELVHNMYGQALFAPPDEEGEESTSAHSLGWWGLYFETAIDGPFGLLPVLYQTDFHDVCVFLVNRVLQRKELEAQQRLQSAQFGIENPNS